jgi:hypothetical protein
MPLKNAPIQQPINQGGIISQVWVLFFNSITRLLSNTDPWQIPSFTVSGVPDATLFEGYIIYVSNESGGKTIAFSDGTNWRRTSDRNVIS